LSVWLVKPSISLDLKHKIKLALLTIPLVSVSFLSVGGAKLKIKLYLTVADMPSLGLNSINFKIEIK
jgi:hypothetical protein